MAVFECASRCRLAAVTQARQSTRRNAGAAETRRMDYYLVRGKDRLATRTEGRSIGGIVGSFERALEGAEAVRDQERIVGQEVIR